MLIPDDLSFFKQIMSNAGFAAPDEAKRGISDNKTTPSPGTGLIFFGVCNISLQQFQKFSIFGVRVLELLVKKTISILFALIFNTTCFAGYFVAGEISCKNLSAFTYQITVQIYIPTASLDDPSELTINWGDGTSSTIDRVSKIAIADDISTNTYTYNGAGTGGIHNYPGPGIYNVWIADSFRTDGIINIPNSGSTGFYLGVLIDINPFLGINNSPDFLNIPFDLATVDSIFNYNPQASDIDGDSLSYRLIPCSGSGITGYTYPSASTIFLLDSLTGDLHWDAPITAGDYNIAMLIEEWRQGHRIGMTTRDMRIHVDGESGIESFFAGFQFNVSPNPTTSAITLRIPPQFGKAEKLDIYNCIGQLQYSREFQPEIDLGSLSGGLYFIVVTNDKGERMTGKVIKE
jgi:hypothetical protein